MDATHPAGYLRLLVSIAALGLLAGLLFLPAPALADSEVPSILGANVNGSAIELFYNDTLDTTSVPATTAFTVVVGTTMDAALESVAISGAKVELILSTAATGTDAVTVTYTVPSANPVQDVAGNDAEALDVYAVANHTGTTTNSRPIFSADTLIRSIAENSATVTEVGEVVVATDPDPDDTLTYILTGVDRASFVIDDSTGQIKTSVALDHEDKDSYSVVVLVSDAKAPDGMEDVVRQDDATAVTINVTDVNEAPRITGGTLAGLRAENTAITEEIANYTASEPDSGDTLTWTLGGADADDFTLTERNSNTQFVLKFAAVPDFENPADEGADNIYNVDIQVSDGRDDAGNPDMAIDDTYDTTITVTDVNEPPDITTKGSSHTAISEPEGTATSEVIQTYAATDPDAGANLMWTLSGDDAGDFTIAGGELKFSAVPDFESAGDANTNNVYSLTVNVRDSLNDAGNTDTAVDDSIAITVTVTNVDDAGTVTISGTLSGGEVLTTMFSDPDGNVSNVLWKWARGATQSGAFTDIPSTNAPSYTTVAADVGKYLRVTATYTDAQGSGKSASAITSGPIGSSNSAPTFDDGTTATRSLAENPTVGTDVGNAIAASDSDSGDTLTYAIKSGNDGGSFTIDATDGQLKSKTGVTYNFESTKKSYTVVVTVHDGTDAAGDASTTVDNEITVTINLTNVNEDPVLTSPPTTLSKPENSTAVHEYAVTDVDAGTVFSWSVSGADSNKFQISQTGVLTFSSAPDFETPTDTGDTAGNNTYVVTVKVEDNGSPVENDAHTLTVTVTDVNETPTITSGPAAFNVDENTAITDTIATYVATDPDATTGTMTWDLQGNDAGNFTIMSTINGTATLHFRNVPNYEAPADNGTNNVYDVTVRVRDNVSTPLQDTQNVAITVNDVNEAPVVSGDAAPDFAEIEFDATSPDLNIGTYTYTDEDLNPSDTITWDLSGTDETHFDIDGSSGALSFKEWPNFEMPVDSGSNNTYVLVVEADDGQGGVGTYNVTVTVTNVDETPEITTLGTSHTAPMFMEIEYDVLDADLTPADYIVAEYEARDEEGQTITWGKTGTDSGDFTIDSGTGVLSFAQRPNFEMPADDSMDNVYNVTVTARDTASNTRELVVTVTVTNVNETPGFTYESTGRNADEIEYDSGTTAADMASIPATMANATYWYPLEARDEEGQDIIWTITGVDADDFVIVEDPDFAMTAEADERAIARWAIVPDFENPMGSAAVGDGQGYEFIVNASDGTNTATHTVFVRILDVNEMPEFTGTPDLAITYNENATIDVADYDARDEEGGVTWSLTGTDASDFDIDSGGVVTFVATPDWEMPTGSQSDDTDIDGNVYTFTVVATDVESGSTRRNVSVDVTVTVADEEEAGTLAVDELEIAVGDRVEFTLTDPDGGIDLTPPTQGQPSPIDWTLQLLSTMGVWQTKQTNNPLGTDFHYVVDEDDTGKKMRVVVTYIDRRGPGKSATSMESEAITADPIPNAPPRFSGGGPNRIAEGGDARNVGDRMTATDRDNDTLTFGIQTSQYSGHFEIHASTGQIRLTQALDFETITGLVLLTITLHDGKGVDQDNMVIADDSVDVTTSLAITVDDVEEEGVVTLSSTEPAVGTPLTATLADGDGRVTGRTWRWSRSENGLSGWTTISGATSSNYTPVDADGDLFLRARVTYTDRRGAGKSAEAVTSDSTPSENRRPTFPSTESGARTVEENTRSGVSIGAPVAAVDPEDDRLVYTLVGADAGAFTIVESTGQLRTSEALDFETKSRYTFTIEVHDGRDSLGMSSTTVDDMQSVTITVENVEEQGTVTLTSDTGTIRARVPVMATLADDDRPTSGTVMWQWARSPTRSNWVNILGATSATFEPTDDDEGNYIRATASYTDGHGTANKTANAVSPRVGDAPPVNSAPVFPSTEDGRREVAENTTGGSTFGDPVVATDFNAGDSVVNDPLSYSLSGTDAASFTIDSGTGQLRLAQGVTLDYEGKRTYRVTVEVTDGANDLGDSDPAGNPVIDARKNVTITLTDVNEAPVVSGEASVSVDENLNRAVGTYSAADPERDTLTWSVTGSDASDFWISQRGQLYFRSPPSYEEDDSYSVTVMAEDEDNLSDTLTVSVTVTDVEEDGVVIISPPRGWADTQTQLLAELDDGDGGETNIMWQWARSSNRSSWTDIATGTSSTYTATADDVDHYLRVIASYTDNRGSGKMAAAVLAGRVGDVRPTELNNAPQFANATEERSVGQGTSAGRPIGAPVRAMDEDPNDILTYTLFGNDASDFDIDRATGQLRTKAVLDHDPEDANTYSVQVSVHDGYGPDYQSTDVGVDDTITVTITVTAVAQRAPGGGGGGGFGPTLTAPRFVDGFRTSRPLPVNALAGDAVGDPVAATHPNDDDVIYSLSGANATLFTVDEETGQIRLGQAVTLALGQSYTVNLTATDSTGTGSIIIVVIEVVEAAHHLYDLNRDGIIEKIEALAAISDYFAELIEKDEVLEVIALYFAG